MVYDALLIYSTLQCHRDFMDKTILVSLNVVLRQFINVVSLFSKEYPLFIFSILIGFYFLMKEALISPLVIAAILSVIITIISILIYISVGRFGETALTFILGLFTVFSVSWDSPKAILFYSCFVFFIVVTLIINSIKLGMRREDILRAAAAHYVANSTRKFENIYEKFKEFATLSSIKYLSPIQRSEGIRYFAFRRVSIEDIKELLDSVETVNIISSLTVTECAEFVYSLYIAVQVKEDKSGYTYRTFLDKLLLLSCSLSDSMKTFLLTKKYFLDERISISTYLSFLDKETKNGLFPEEIRDKFENDPSFS